MTLELVVFDMAGTTIADGDAVNRCLRQALGASGVVVSPDAVNAVMGIPKPEAIRRLLQQSSGSPVGADRVAFIHADFATRMRATYESDPSIGEVPGMGRLFAALRREGVKVALDTGFSRDIADILLGRLGWGTQGVLDATITSDEVARGRPAPEMIERLMHHVGVHELQRVAKVGDTPADLEQGMRARCGLVIGVTWGTHSRAQLARLPHTHLVDTVDELARALRVGR
jgi:phosphonatase-like hydrolase